MRSEALSLVGTESQLLWCTFCSSQRRHKWRPAEWKKKVQHWESESWSVKKKTKKLVKWLEWKPVYIWLSVAPLSSDSKDKNEQVKCAPPPSVSIFYSRILIGLFNVSIYPQWNTPSNRCVPPAIYWMMFRPKLVVYRFRYMWSPPSFNLKLSLVLFPKNWDRVKTKSHDYSERPPLTIAFIQYSQCVLLSKLSARLLFSGVVIQEDTVAVKYHSTADNMFRKWQTAT